MYSNCKYSVNSFPPTTCFPCHLPEPSAQMNPAPEPSLPLKTPLLSLSALRPLCPRSAVLLLRGRVSSLRYHFPRRHCISFVRSERLRVSSHTERSCPR